MKPEVISEGKTKTIRQAPWSNAVFIESKDDITAGDGAKKDSLEEKGRLATETTCNCFILLEANGIKTHFIVRIDSVTFLARKAAMIPVELVARRIATGSFLKRKPTVPEGIHLEPIVLEAFYKDDDLHDPLMLWSESKQCFELYDAKKPVPAGYIKDFRFSFGPVSTSLGYKLEKEEMDELLGTTESVFQILEKAWSAQGVDLVDLKIECGFTSSGDVVVADVIDNDSWRIWPGGDKARMVDKQVYRDLEGSSPEALGAIRKNYAWVAESTRKFLG